MDSAKRRFGVSIDQVTRILVALDLRRGNIVDAFADLERGRARAFVDMLGAVTGARGRDSALVEQIYTLSDQIRCQRIINAAPGHGNTEGVSQVETLMSDREHLILELRVCDPEMADVLSISSADLASVQAALGPSDQLLYALPAETPQDSIRFLDIRAETSRIVDCNCKAPVLCTIF